MKISIFSPVKNEADFIGYSIMSVLPYVHEILYGVAESSDGTMDLLRHIKKNYAGDKLRLFLGGCCEPNWNFDPMDMDAYNAAYNYLIKEATGDAVWFLHPDMIVTNPEQIAKIAEGPYAWWTHVSSFAGDLQTKITAGRADRWKNIHIKGFGLHYYGGYGSQNEDLYFRDITGDVHKHFNANFDEYPFEVADSGVHVNHYCELKTYARRLEKMRRCLKTLNPTFEDRRIDEMAAHHPRVTLDPSNKHFGLFEFTPSDDPVPEVFNKHSNEFEPFKKVVAHA